MIQSHHTLSATTGKSSAERGIAESGGPAENAVFLTAGKTPESGGGEQGKTCVVSDG